MITFRQIKPNLARVYVGELEIVFSYDTPSRRHPTRR